MSYPKIALTIIAACMVAACICPVAHAGDLPGFARPLPLEVVTVSGNVIIDNGMEIMWERTVNGKKRIHLSAYRYCLNLTLDGLSDWRMPSIEELQSIADKSESPAFKAGYGAPAGRYWAIQRGFSVGDNRRTYEFVDFSNDAKTGKFLSEGQDVGPQYHIRCVHDITKGK